MQSLTLSSGSQLMACRYLPNQVPYRHLCFKVLIFKDSQLKIMWINFQTEMFLSALFNWSENTIRSRSTSKDTRVRFPRQISLKHHCIIVRHTVESRIQGVNQIRWAGRGVQGYLKDSNRFWHSPAKHTWWISVVLVCIQRVKNNRRYAEYMEMFGYITFLHLAGLDRWKFTGKNEQCSF